MELPTAADSPCPTNAPAPTAEQLEAARARLAAWFEALPAATKSKPAVFWHHATEQLKPMTGDLAFELGTMLGREYRLTAMTAFKYAAEHATPEGYLGVAAGFLWSGHASEALAALDAFFKANPFWRVGVERVFNPVLRELFHSGVDLPATMRRSIFAYSFVAYKQGSVLPAADTDDYQFAMRTWFMSGLPSALQPQVSVGATLALGLATLAALALVGFVAAGRVPPVLLPILIPYASSMRKTYRANKWRKATRRDLAAAWAQETRG